MGFKPLPLFKEIFNNYIKKKEKKKKKKFSKKCLKRIFPSKNWALKFSQIAQQKISQSSIEKDLKRTTQKIKNYKDWCAAEGLTLQQVCLAAKKWQQLFLQPEGEFYWFFKHLKLAEKQGSFFFVHAGVDDSSAKMIRKKGFKWLNKQFRKKLKTDLFDLYYGSLGNMIRTKYRNYDRHFSKKGALMMHNSAINVIVHGHRNLYHGQRLMLRNDMINFECDTSLDINTRKKEGLAQKKGASVTIIHPDKLILGISSDYPFIKVFAPELNLNLCP